MPGPGEFYDVESGGDARFQLEHTHGKQFKLLRQFGYVDLMPPHATFVVPHDVNDFETDLASTPDYFTWLIPGVGVHLPAILLHDGLVYNGKPSFIGPPIDRHEADRIFRDAMKALGTGPIRRWMIWAASALATAWEESKGWKALLIVTALLMGALGGLATLDLFDVVNFLPWMDNRPFFWEFLWGGVAALVTPFFISLPCLPKRYTAMLIASIAFAFLVHVTLVIAALLALYKVFEWLARRIERWSRDRQTSPAPQQVYEQSGSAS